MTTLAPKGAEQKYFYLLFLSTMMEIDNQSNNSNNNNNNNNRYVLFETSKGGIIVELYRDKARLSCERFTNQIEVGRYQDTIIHRIVKNLFIQCGRYSINSSSLDNSLMNNNDSSSNSNNDDSITSFTSTSTTTSIYDNNNNNNNTQPTSLNSSSTILNQLYVDSSDDDELEQEQQQDDIVYISDNKESNLTNSKKESSSSKQQELLDKDQFKRLIKENNDNGLSFNERGLVAMGSYNQIIFTLDACGALNRKYPIIGRVHPSTMQMLCILESTPTNESNCPIDPIFLTNIHFISDVEPQEDTPPSIPPTPKLQSPQILPPPSRESSTSSYSSSSLTSQLPLETPKKRSVEFDSTPIIKRLKTKIKTGLIRTPSRILDHQHALMTCNLNPSSINPLNQSNIKPMGGMARSMSMPYINTQKVKLKWPTRLVIIRHGQSEQNAALDVLDSHTSSIRDADIKLTEVGKWQSRETGKHLAKTDQFDLCFVSPYIRAIQTAEEIISQLPYKIKMYKDNWLREKEFGRGHGLAENQFKQQFPEEYEIRKRDGKYWYRLEGGENYPDVELRCHCFLEKLSRDYAGRSVLLVTHQVPYKMFMGLFHHLDEQGILGLEEVYNCGMQEYLVDTSKSVDGRMKLKHFNLKAYEMNQVPLELKYSPNTKAHGK
ncbi:phosphoglycerate/bisphosphoglycerate mutase [Cavenderia fasciculata]|uniref:Phosphoglycerate/bisphosphoglycerate mutase n=1 Tax=Cavenderia fasciculata TaxID=261658 RepID=F4QEI0_CACFS|nr:phosphoglycerate/bisphosphoglycerate mutase [Cavenderia fasciculata]EGG14091.1 phosphoglycerate/bisphosphoglycerate mutase [Cavenderia fasciculata]|eukprot:XP_004350799.1 phosphoglycerate/bisphosphoglycerate mutase [Cavenderia fasciculata]